MWGVDRPPASLGGVDQFERHGQAGRSRSRALGDLGPQADRGEGGLDRVGGLEMGPVLGGEVEERQQHLGLVDDLGHRLGPLRTEGVRERRDRRLGMGPVFGVADLRQRPAGCGLGRLGQRVQHIRGDVHPAALLFGLGEHLAQGGPEPQRPVVPDGQHRGAHAAALAVS